MKKTLLITLEFPPQVGGIASYTQQLAEVLDPKQTIVLAPPLITPEEEVQTPYRLIRSPFYISFFWPHWVRLFFSVRKLVKTEHVERILVHHILPVGTVAYFIKKLFKIPYLIFSHGTDVSFAMTQQKKRALVEKICKDAEQLIFNSQSLKQRFLTNLPQFADKATVLYPCPDTSFLEPVSNTRKQELRELFALNGKNVLLTVSRLVDGKGIPRLIRLMPELLKQNPHLIWFVVGDGPKREFLLNMVEKHALQNVVRFVGSVPHSQLREYYALAEVFVLLTHPDNGLEEGLGLVFLEAAATGLPVVAGKSGGVEEAVEHGITGLVVDTNNKDEVLKAILLLLQDHTYAVQLGVAGQERVKTQFDWSERVRVLGQWIG